MAGRIHSSRGGRGATQAVRTAGVALAALAAAFAVPLHASDYYVATDGSDATGDGSSAAPFLTISNAIEHASAGGGDTIHVGPGLYEITAQLEVAKPVAIIGTEGRDATEVRRAEIPPTNKTPSSNFVARCLYLDSADARVEGLTFSRGYLFHNSAADSDARPAKRGAGVYVAAGSLVSCAVTNCHVGRSKVGGALALQGASAYASNCLVSCNASYATSYEHLGTGVTASGGEMVDCAITDNAYVGATYPRGTGLYIEAPASGSATPVTVRRCRITGNYDAKASYVSYWGTAAGVPVAAVRIGRLRHALFQFGDGDIRR